MYFTTLAEATSHARTHTDTMTFGCLARECNVQYQNKADRDRHVAIEHKGKGG